jgi:hypothetical protein
MSGLPVGVIAAIVLISALLGGAFLHGPRKGSEG